MSVPDGMVVIDRPGLVAELFVCQHPAPLPAVLVVGAAEEGAPARRLAGRLALAGYAVLAVGPERIGLADFSTVLERMRQLPLFDLQRIGLIGIGAGAEQALLMAAQHAEIRAVVAVAPGSGARVPVERIAGPILLVAGMDDSRWPALETADRIIERLATHRFAHGVSLHSYGDAGHWLFGPPLESSDPLASRLSQAGGSIIGNCTARLDSWRKTISFLGNSLSTARAEQGEPLLIHDDCWVPG